MGTTMKIFILFLALMAKDAIGQKASGKISVGGKAASTFQNCNCQCNSDTWTDGQYIRGNCRSKDRTGALFCYVSGSALNSCRDVKRSSFLQNNNGQFKFYSYEACTTPPRNQCNNGGGFNQNLGSGDIGVITGGGSNNGGWNNGGSGWNNGGSGWNNGGSGWNNGGWRNPGSSSSSRPSRPSSSSNGRPSLGSILNGSIRNGGSSDNGVSSGGNGINA